MKAECHSSSRSIVINPSPFILHLSFPLLDSLADSIVRLAMSGDQTPVLVTPPEFSLRAAFFAELGLALNTRVRNPIAIEIVREPGSTSEWGSPVEWIGHWRATRLAKQATRMIESSGIRVDCAAMLRRPRSETLVVGCCDSGVTLPPWAAPIELATTSQRS